MCNNNFMSNNNINKFYRPATWESICFNDPEKAMVLDSYFEKIRWTPRRSSVPTVNLTYGIISPVVTHISYPGYEGYPGEYAIIIKSCKTGDKVNMYYKTTYNGINNCRFAYAADVPTSILKEFIDKTVCWKYPCHQYKKVFENKSRLATVSDENVFLKEENETLKKQLSEFKKSVENLYNMTTK